jgi:surface antigen
MRLSRAQTAGPGRGRWLGALAVLILVLVGLLVHGDQPGILAAPLAASVAASPIELSHLSDVTSITPGSCANNDPLNPYNPFDNDQCTWWAWERRHQIGEDLPSTAWGDAKNWTNMAIASGYPTGTVPTVGAVVVCQPTACGGAFASGHVAFVEKVFSPTSFQVSEQNWVAACFIDTRTVSTDTGVSFIYFLSGTSASTPKVTQTPTPTITPTSSPTRTPTQTPLPVCTPSAILPAPSPFPTETNHALFLPYLFAGGKVVCNTPSGQTDRGGPI